ncbi:MAG: AAA family ATPase [Lachnospiraceae bacterium]|nr:AAA family ATPase [Lachnospiraceae bacterium]
MTNKTIVDEKIYKYCLKKKGAVSKKMIDVTVDENGMYHMQEALKVDEDRSIDDFTFTAGDLEKVIDEVPVGHAANMKEKVSLSEPIILTKKGDSDREMKWKFKLYQDECIKKMDEQILKAVELMEKKLTEDELKKMNKNDTADTESFDAESLDTESPDAESSDAENSDAESPDTKNSDAENSDTESPADDDMTTEELDDLTKSFQPDDDMMSMDVFGRSLKAESLLINYNERFKDSQPTMYRDEVIDQTLSCLIGRTKPNALLIGAAGVGKTKIAEDIARRIANGDPTIPEQLSEMTIWELPISNIIEGSSLVGDVERKAKAVIDFACDPENKCILFIDEIHLLVGGASQYEKVAQIFKPALARGDMRVIAATTLQESKMMMNDPAFNRRFTRLIVDELSKKQTEEILKSMRHEMYEFYNCKITLPDEIMHEVVQIAEEFRVEGSHRPDNAITLLDRTMADKYITLRKEVMEGESKNSEGSCEGVAGLTSSFIRKTAMKLMTGNNNKKPFDRERLVKRLSVIKGQSEVLELVTDILHKDSMGVYPRTRPLCLLFAGSSGVGKTEVAKILAEEITEEKPIILNMTEYNDSATVNRIVGSPIGYKGSESNAELPFDILESNPYRVVLLDEFEKADLSVQRLFMSAFDEGYIRTSRGKIVDFSKTIIIATTNAGHKNVSERIGFSNDSKAAAIASVDNLAIYIDKELLNRFTRIIDFNPISREVFKEILMETYRRDVAGIKERRPDYSFLRDEIDSDVAERLTKENYLRDFGARPVNRLVKDCIEEAVLKGKQ